MFASIKTMRIFDVRKRELFSFKIFLLMGNQTSVMGLSEKMREYCKVRQSDFLPVKSHYYSFSICLNDNIIVKKNNFGYLYVQENRINEVALELKQFLGEGKYFVYNKKRAKNILTLIK